MRLLVQRVHKASVHVDAVEVASINAGLLVLVGFGEKDTAHMPGSKLWTACIDKLLHLRIFPGDTEQTAHKFQRDILDFHGEILLVSQFTLFAHCKNGRRPDFQKAAPPAMAAQLFDQWVQDIDAKLPSRVHSGIFGAMMDVSLTNWGPVTLMLDSEELFPQLHEALQV